MITATHDFVRAVVTDPEVWPHLAEDGDHPGDFEPCPSSHYFRHGDWGFVEFRPCGARWYQAHIAMRRGATGVREFSLACLAHMRCLGALAFTGFIPASNRAALINAQRCGFVEEGRMRGVYLKHGQLVDMVVMGAR